MRISKRKNRRGVAMPEAIVVMTTMLVFLGMILWAHRAYAGKIDQLATTRSDVLYYASHACEATPPVDDPLATSPTFAQETDQPVATGDESTETADAIGSALPAEGGPSSFKRDWNMASTSRSAVVEGSAIVNLQKQALTTTVKTTSHVACNEKNYGGDWMALAKFVWDLPKNGAGILGP